MFIAAMSVAAQDVTHIIQKGETIYSIARSYGVNQRDILTLNGIRDPQRIQPGQRLRIPVTGAGPEAGEFVEYRVARGESFYGIARRYETTVELIRRANNFADTYVLKEGDVLKIPRPAGAAATVAVTGNGTPATTAPENPGGGTPAGGTGGGSPGEVPAGTTRTETAGAAGGQSPSQVVPAPRPTVTGKVDPSLRWPVSAKEVMYMTGKLYGVVLLGEQSESVQSLTQGTVVSAGPYRGFGKVAIVQMAGGYLYVYGGCESLSVKEGDRVTPGTELGRLGIDAVSAKPQLFFLVYRSNTPIDPAKAPRALS
ncbi:MAG: LysM peptidoglycan-binding domain-containing protein [Spirochaetaceae bacterium]|nr:LysM peptidoglycan-binding domain-containing protein [Spirochaetaceae bacterium]